MREDNAALTTSPPEADRDAFLLRAAGHDKVTLARVCHAVGAAHRCKHVGACLDAPTLALACLLVDHAPGTKGTERAGTWSWKQQRMSVTRFKMLHSVNVDVNKAAIIVSPRSQSM